MIKINEIFFSIQGESSSMGWPTIFIRTSGCHLRCTYCDTTYAYYEGFKLSIQEILDRVSAFPCRKVCVTGGEPLLQTEVVNLMSELVQRGYEVSLETSGSISCESVDPRVRKIIDVKTPDSGEPDSFLNSNLNYASAHDEFKFVVCSEKDFDWSVEFVQKHKLAERHLVLFSPSHGKISEQWLAEQIIRRGLPVRMQLQLHKYIWAPEARGV